MTKRKLTYHSYLLNIIVGGIVGLLIDYEIGVLWLLTSIAVSMVHSLGLEVEP